MEGTAGTEVDIRYSEKLNSDGTVNNEGANAQTDTYIVKGGGPETYEPKYGWKGYRYIQVWTRPAHPCRSTRSAASWCTPTWPPTEASPARAAC